jgi:hypothetical protein
MIGRDRYLIKFGAIAIFFLNFNFVFLAPVQANSLSINCPTIKKFSEFEVNYMVRQLNEVIGAKEAGKLYSRYIAFKSECSINPNLTFKLALSQKLKDWLVQNDVQLESGVASMR